MSKSNKVDNMVVDTIMAKYNKEAGVTVVGPLTEFDLNFEVIPTGNLILDVATGVGGFALGKMYEVTGDKEASKSSLCVSLARQHLRNTDRKVLYVDIENASTASLLTNFGIYEYSDRFFRTQVAVAEVVLELTLDLIRTEEFSLVIIDSVPSILPQNEVNKTLDDVEMVGERAKLIQRFILKANPLIGATKTTMVLINQLRTDIKMARQMPMANPMKSTGGKAVEYFPSCKVTLQQMAAPKNPRFYDDLGIKYAAPIKATIGKNRLALTCDLGKYSTLLLGFGFDPIYDLLEIGEVACQIVKRGSWLSFRGERLGQGLINAHEALIEDKELRDSIASSVFPLLGINDYDKLLGVMDDFVDRKKALYDTGRVSFTIANKIQEQAEEETDE